MAFNNLLPAGIRFFPSDEEIVRFYVHNENFNTHLLQPNHISDVNIYDFHPQELTHRYPPMIENEWYFYYKKDSFSTTSKNNKRFNRKAKNETWHGNATKKSIFNQHKIQIGLKRTLDFIEPDKKLTLWKMTEYHLLQSNDTHSKSRLKVYMNDEKNIAVEQEQPNNASTELMNNELESIAANLDNFLADQSLLADLDQIFQN
ncbi:hypothetical protein F8388_014930 [Cannabis sativa]|uniref:NAC domain-containing protein n=1 Tax=Cannabis sativa TaxID=3483 RepID=A0A7J6F673_CANSA|nr:hypothetical protein F8388_014930 [Cannabis sativa]